MALPTGPAIQLESHAWVTRVGSKVSSWGDIAENADATQGTDAARPVYDDSTVVNGRPAITFSAATFLNFNGLTQYVDGNDPSFTAMILFTPETAGGAKSAVAAIGGVQDRTEIFRVTGTPQLLINRRDGSSEDALTILSSMSYGTSYLALVRATSTSYESVVFSAAGSGLQAANSTINRAALTLTSGYIGQAGPSSQAFTGDVHGFWLWDRAITGAVGLTPTGEVADAINYALASPPSSPTTFTRATRTASNKVRVYASAAIDTSTVGTGDFSISGNTVSSVDATTGYVDVTFSNPVSLGDSITASVDYGVKDSDGLLVEPVGLTVQSSQVARLGMGLGLGM